MKPIVLAIVLSSAAVLFASESLPYKELAPGYSRTRSMVMARSIDVPSRAHLDFAAYNANPVRFDPEKQKPKKPAQPVTLRDMTFKGALLKAVATIEETPLTKNEVSSPYAWAPLMNLLWTELKADGFRKLGSAIIGEKWNDPEIFKPYQDIAALYLHRSGDKIELWVKIEFMPWVKFLKGIQDADNDGFREIFGLLSTGSIEASQLEASVGFITGDYATRPLNREEIVDWANVLASYWYPTLNTDIVTMDGFSSWPTAETEVKVRKAAKKLVIDDPVAVIRGNPYGKVLYNVFVVPKLGKSKVEQSATVAHTVAALDTAVSANFRGNNERFVQELKPWGDYAAWHKDLALVHNELKNVLSRLPAEQMGIQGKDGWLFFRKSIDYILAPDDLTKQPPDKNPLSYLVEFKSYLDKNNVNFLFVAVPCKEELYPEKLGLHPGDVTGAIVAPYGRKFLADLQKNGIEVIDLLPAFLEAKTGDALSTEPLYQKHDTHWTNRGLQVASRFIADRIRTFSWYDSCAAQKVAYTTRDTIILRQGDIVERIPEAVRGDYPAASIEARQVLTPEGTKYKPVASGPVMLIGDSFTGVFELVDCKGAGVGANIAHQTALPVDILTGWGGGPMIMNKMLRIRKATIGAKRLVIYMMTARDLYNFSQGWEKLKVE
ncbi:MAG: hypothetical protein JXA71_04895 [Chitinispirillaceae bacterium]|nr:hypothetical protein [Chitinispirillaceae bacterium]